ncbi:hypothetical protein FQP90_13325 [Paenarthrobacter nitroguajacolicus]|uniref:Uncharacterized protein n=1 Tax=Paenarthrobacter nitroguajacolicus TaxID=211146 RepID=A0A558GYS0_PAENT|nr:hypothetical protein [Paenarthrobacter nitroguajacolicus]TVU62033.1 hypothetical protein FQP90_13325 [Paenarthrobacter nitroguajacolicus]
MNGAFEVSVWAREAFGGAAGELSARIPEAIRSAHATALTAHVAADMTTNDTYGHTLKVKQYELLVAQVREVPGVMIRRPQGMRFDLAVVPETNVAILPLRYATDRKDRREDSRLAAPVSDLRQSLLGLNSSAAPRQLTIDHAFVDDDALASGFEELEELDRQLRRFGRLVVIGYASNPAAGVWGIGWGDLELKNAATGEITWPHWETLPEISAGSAATHSLAADLSVVGRETSRFDSSTEDDDDFGLVARPSWARVPVSETTNENTAAERGVGE